MKNMLKLSNLFIVLLLLVLYSCSSAKVGNLPIATNRESNVILILPENPTDIQNRAAADFVKTIQKATGAAIPIFKDASKLEKSKTQTRIILGPSALTKELGYDAKNLAPESFAIYHKNGNIIILAEDIVPQQRLPNIWNAKESVISPVTQWAFGYLLDHHVGVRWLWPGDLGTYVPKVKTLVFSAIDTIVQQKLIRRNFNPITTNPENVLWLGYHQFSGQRKLYKFQHAFRKSSSNGDWWEEFSETRPELLAQNPNGEVELFNNRKNFYKLCLSNQAVTDEIVSRWKAKGSPDFWDITPNDGNGFCTCDNCMDLDEKYGGKRYTKEQVWRRKGNVSLTGRYVWFWNKVITEMRKTNANAKVGVFLYSAYREAPTLIKLEPGIVGQMVSGFDFKGWQEWREAGVSEIGLRPNWLYMGASAPHLPLHKVGAYIENARDNGLALIDMDSFFEYWATQGPYYYLLGRLVTRPDLNTEQIIDEYASAFENAASKIKEYLKYWEDYHEEVAYNIPAGGSLFEKENGLYEKLSIEHFGEAMHPLKGHWRTLPYIYTEEKLTEAQKILQEAKQVANSKEVEKRIEFLKDGLVLLEKNIAYITALNSKDKSKQETSIVEIQKFHSEMVTKYGYWNSKELFVLKHWGLIGEEMNTEGM